MSYQPNCVGCNIRLHPPHLLAVCTLYPGQAHIAGDKALSNHTTFYCSRQCAHSHIYEGCSPLNEQDRQRVINYRMRMAQPIADFKTCKRKWSREFYRELLEKPRPIMFDADYRQLETKALLDYLLKEDVATHLKGGDSVFGRFAERRQPGESALEHGERMHKLVEEFLKVNPPLQPMSCGYKKEEKKTMSKTIEVPITDKWEVSLNAGRIEVTKNGQQHSDLSASNTVLPQGIPDAVRSEVMRVAVAFQERLPINVKTGSANICAFEFKHDYHRNPSGYAEFTIRVDARDIKAVEDLQRIASRPGYFTLKAESPQQ